MDPSTAVSTSAAISLFGFAVVIFLLLFLIAKLKWHVFPALLIPIILSKKFFILFLSIYTISCNYASLKQLNIF